VSNLEEITTSAAGTTTTTYYYAGGQRLALAVNGVFSYLGDDVLGSPTAVLNAVGTLSAAQLYGPYGAGRYSYGTWPAAGATPGSGAMDPAGWTTTSRATMMRLRASSPARTAWRREG
jgi:hypothetical protein